MWRQIDWAISVKYVKWVLKLQQSEKLDVDTLIKKIKKINVITLLTMIITKSEEEKKLCPTYLSKTRQVLLFTALSDLYRLWSSNKSLIAVTDSTKMSGAMAMYLPNAFISGIKFNITIAKK